MTPTGTDPDRIDARPSTARRLLTALGVSALAGVFAAALALPVVGGAGLAAKATADEFLRLPVDFASPRLAQRSQVLAADGSRVA